jgi:hypothetical protein
MAGCSFLLIFAIKIIPPIMAAKLIIARTEKVTRSSPNGPPPNAHVEQSRRANAASSTKSERPIVAMSFKFSPSHPIKSGELGDQHAADEHKKKRQQQRPYMASK